ncbi:unnamed protein product (macronuclear) [Paramecium tetraurelia]|uniref:DH domain-containing protein n=1 Tax=Paramecium tetraurelia TaxID=5888 RepID=A0BKK3_PARTE|nr:uncharacterized protein GSPATT00029701001 [Paramecium tetraurelia]CAK59070.1 unnamed protein product [Paramecium tetraurelia]|eukprot:XP_001426468.1 hypothetical protein (macronuclear) [Paramecium tetraurelia strain d4-2]
MNPSDHSTKKPKKAKPNMFQIFQYQYLKTQPSQTHKESFLPTNSNYTTTKLKLNQIVQNTSINKSTRASHKVKLSMSNFQDDEETIGRISATVKEARSILEENEQPQQMQRDHLQQIVCIQSKIRTYLVKKRVAPLKKTHKYRYRKQVLNELLATEEIYCSALKTMIHSYLKPLSDSKGILSSSEIKGLFSNIQSIYLLSQETLILFKDLQKDYHQEYQNAIKQLLSHANFFKIYQDYLINYANAIKLQTNLRHNNKQYKSFLDQADKKNLGKTLENYYLILPVQRIPKYVLLFKDYLKNLNQENVDYPKFQKILQEFEAVANQNNKAMDNLLSKQQIFELQQQYGKHVKILELNRQFLKEESLQMYFTIESEVRPVIVYFFSDLILITERDQIKQGQVFRTYITLNHLSQCNKMAEMYNYKFLYQINGSDNHVTFVVQSQDSEKDLKEQIEFVNEIIQQLQDKKDRRNKLIQEIKPANLPQEEQNAQQNFVVTVQIQGTQELLDNSNKKFTRYVFEIVINNIITQQIYLRFSQFKTTMEFAKSKFPNIKIPEIKENNYFDRNEALVVDRRKLLMTEFLLLLLNSKDFKTDNQYQKQILNQLGLHENFYSLLRKLKEEKERESANLSVLNFRGIKKPLTTLIENSFKQASFRKFDQSNVNTIQTQVSTPRGPVKPMGDLVRQMQQTATKNEVQQQSEISELPQEQKQNIKGLRASSMINSRKVSASQLLAADTRCNSRQGSMIVQGEGNLQLVKIKVLIFQNFKPIEQEYQICRETDAEQLRDEVAADIQLQYSYDFKLYLLDDQMLKPLDKDEKLWNLLIRTDETKGLFKKAQNQPQYNQKLLQLRKYLYVNCEEETEFCKCDLVRLTLVSYQLFDDITNQRLILESKNHVICAALYLILNKFKKIDKNNIPFNEVKKLIPHQIFKYIQQDTWVNFLPTIFDNFYTLVMSEYADDQKKEKQKSKQNQDTEKNTNHEEPNNQITESDISDNLTVLKTEAHYAMLIFLDILKSTKFFGVTNFKVQSDKETLMYLYELSKHYWEEKKKQNKFSSSYTIDDCRTWSSFYLCINYKCITFLKQLNSQLEILELDYEEIEQISSLQKNLGIYIFNPLTNNYGIQINKKICLNFETEKSYQIKQLIQTYDQMQMENRQAQELQCDEEQNFNEFQ